MLTEDQAPGVAQLLRDSIIQARSGGFKNYEQDDLAALKKLNAMCKKLGWSTGEKDARLSDEK